MGLSALPVLLYAVLKLTYCGIENTRNMVLNVNWRDPILINTIGHSAGVLLFGLIIALLLRDWRTHGMRRIKLSLGAAVLALGWNIGSLVVLASPDPASKFN